MIIYSDDSIVVVNKPSGLPVQPDKSGDPSVLDEAGKSFDDLRVIHRIDRPASGLVLLARGKKAAANLSEQFRSGKVEKIYLCAVDNPPPQEEGRLHSSLSRAKTARGKSLNKSVSSGSAAGNSDKGQECELYYRKTGSTDKYHILEIKLVTGRRHQIRAQLAEIGCHIRGDIKYGARRTNRGGGINLHSYRMSFSHPVTGKKTEFTAPLPDDPVWNAVRDADPSAPV